MPDMTVVFAPLLANDFSSRGGAFTNAITERGYDSCPIVMYRFGELAIDRFKQGIAHEVFHCFQGENLERQMRPPASARKWWFEVTASYFSNVVYPQTNLEHRWLDDFNTNSAKSMLQDMSYENSLLFQYLGNKYGDAWIISDLLKAMPTAPESTEFDQADSLASRWDGLQEFGQDFLDGKIEDSSGELIPTDALPLILTNAQPELKFLNKGDYEERGAFVFKLARYRLVYYEGKKYTQEPETNEAIVLGQILACRR